MALTMEAPAPTLEQRRHPRAQLSLPVRLRWPTALGLLTEVAETLDASRGGLLFSRQQPCEPGIPLWVTFPFDPTFGEAQPEMPARVARVKVTPSGSHLVGVAFGAPRPSALDAALGELRAAITAGNRRRHPRIPLALPISVRAQDWPWPEETMTIDVSSEGVLFETPRIYAPGAIVRVTLPYGRWALSGEVPARVLRVEPLSGSVHQRVALALLPVQKENMRTCFTRKSPADTNTRPR